MQDVYKRQDAFRFYRYAEKNRRIVGDFVWSGMDYLGEVGIGAWEYPDYAPEFSHGTGWVAAGAGRIDLTGKATAEMAYTRVAFGTDAIGIGVIPVSYTHLPLQRRERGTGECGAKRRISGAELHGRRVWRK